MLAIDESAMNCGMFPPGVLDVAMRHSTLPFSSSWRRSTLAYRPLTPFSSSFAYSSSPVTSTGIETMILSPHCERYAKIGMANTHPVRGDVSLSHVVCTTVKTRGETGGGNW